MLYELGKMYNLKTKGYDYEYIYFDDDGNRKVIKMNNYARLREKIISDGLPWKDGDNGMLYNVKDKE